MPVLNYKCSLCGKEFAKLFFSEKNAAKQCPVCKGADLQEIGLAFPEYQESNKGLMSVSCEGCGEDSCGLGPST